MPGHACLHGHIAVKGELGEQLQSSIPAAAKDVLLELGDSVWLHLDSLHGAEGGPMSSQHGAAGVIGLSSAIRRCCSA